MNQLALFDVPVGERENQRGVTTYYLYYQRGADRVVLWKTHDNGPAEFYRAEAYPRRVPKLYTSLSVAEKVARMFSFPLSVGIWEYER